MHKKQLKEIRVKLDRAKVSDPDIYHHVENVHLAQVIDELNHKRKPERMKTTFRNRGVPVSFQVDFGEEFNLMSW